MSKKFIVGKLYCITFADHSTGSLEKMVCQAVGFLHKDNGDFLTLTHWKVLTGDSDTKAANIEPTNILKSCIIRSRKFT